MPGIRNENKYFYLYSFLNKNEFSCFSFYIWMYIVVFISILSKKKGMKIKKENILSIISVHMI